jgi:hypothetical protein
VDYVFKWLALRFLPESDLKELGLANGVGDVGKSATETVVR